MSGSTSSPLSPPAPPSSASSSSSSVVDSSDDYNFDLSQLKPPPSFSEKFWKKAKQDPLVPIGFVATCAALTGGVISMVRARSDASQRFMRLRVGAQAFTLVAVVYALYNAGNRGSAGSGAEATPAAVAEQQQPATATVSVKSPV